VSMKVLYMINKTVRLGMKYMLAGLLLIIIVTFFHKELSGLFLFSLTEEARLFSVGILSGGIIGGAGVLISALGFLCQSGTNDRFGPAPLFIIIIGLIAIIFLLFFSCSKTDDMKSVHPGETVSI
jgi:hypothetical protein